MTKKNILISDANHGGLILLEEYSKFTSNNLFFYDVYDKLSDDEKNNLKSKFNVTFLTLDKIKSREDSFVKINPVHMPPVIDTDYTHHEFVGYLLKKNNLDTKIIQVTGVKGKTSATTFISNILSDFNTLVLTSNSLTYNSRVLIEHLSITPASIITAINMAKEEEIIDNIDYCIFEVSLGVVPSSYLNVLTNVLEDYPIAGGTKSASVAKSNVFSSEITICDYDSHVEYYSKNECITLSVSNTNANIFAENINYSVDNTSFVMHYFEKNYTISHFALSDFYINNLLFGISTGLIIGMSIDDIISKLENIGEIPGRNSYKKVGDKLIIEDINPGLNTTSISRCINNLEKFNEKVIIILGGDYGITCEEINEEKLVMYIEDITEHEIILAGKLGENLVKKLGKKHDYFSTLPNAIQHVLNKKDCKLIQAIYRSEYNKFNKDLEYLNKFHDKHI